MIKTIVTPLVGSYHRAPAKQVLSVLPIGSKLSLVPEPDNPYDPLAVQVFVHLGSNFPIAKTTQLSHALEGTGWDAVELLTSHEPLHLGYIPRSGTKTALGGPGNREVIEAIATAEGDRPFEARLGVAPEGRPTVIITILEKAPVCPAKATQTPTA